MQHIGQRLDVHQPMLDGNIQQSGKRKAVARAINRPLGEFVVQSSSNSGDIVVHGFNRRPVRRLIRGQSSAHRIDAEGEQPVKFRVKTFQAESALVQQIPVKGFKVPNVKNDAVAFGDGPFVPSCSTNDLKEGVTSLASVEQTLELLRDGNITGSEHSGTPVAKL